ncbi:MerR family transcriptional regulator [Maritalea sp.]|jgi:DNA-binding transcriptional MerR regulator|uniref:MerR family transcriptional regulator n=1 Tax=Maritalea sp. TaxID=2003361 RepID=UPI0039E58958
MKIGVAAKKLGITSSAIRFYERKGLIRPIGRVSGRRELDEQTLLTLQFLKLAQSAGFTLVEATDLLSLGFGTAREAQDWQTFLDEKQEQVQQRIDDLRRMASMLEQFKKCECVDLKDCMTAPQSSEFGTRDFG